MSEHLTIRLNDDPTSPVPWAVWSTESQQVMASGELSDHTQLADLQEYAQQRPVYVLIAGHTVTTVQVELPPGSRSQVQTVVPYLLEEQLAEDIDQLHFAVLARQGNQAWVAVVRHELMQQWLADLAAANLPVKMMLPDYLALPWHAEQGVSAVEYQGEVLLRWHAHVGVTVEADLLPMALMGLQALSTAPAKDKSEAQSQDLAADLAADITDPIAANEDEAAAVSPSEPVAEVPAVDQTTLACYSNLTAPLPSPWHATMLPQEMVLGLLAEGMLNQRHTLLQGPYRRQAPWRRHWLLWRKVAIAAAVVLVLQLISTFYAVVSQERLAEQLIAQNNAVFRQVFPNKKRIPTRSYLRNQLKQEHARLVGGGTNVGVLPWLAQISEKMGVSSGINVQTLKYDGKRNELRIQATSPDFARFETLKKALADKYDVDVGQLNQESGVVSGVLVLRRR
ncbi:Type II secretion system protein L [Vibrio stylophorae]|uniref:Type II secretion system protein L n=1 Tax=Vibrio stylophorae TaxID=659351 RepID=A0ABM8ZPW5_9VIBR|nr:type II secretion system protein GspL [Vibrio stylophorae]CAH0532344.1 Type II secretion system protein L [Vibrio stylophorae]